MRQVDANLTTRLLPKLQPIFNPYQPVEAVTKVPRIYLSGDAAKAPPHWSGRGIEGAVRDAPRMQ